MTQFTTASNLEQLVEEINKIIQAIAVSGSTVTTAEQFIKMTVDMFLKILEVYVETLDEDQDVVINDDLINKIIDCASVGFRATIIAEDKLLGGQSDEVKEILRSNIQDEKDLIDQLNSILKKEKQNGNQQESQENEKSSGSESEAGQENEI